jgi:hypothetical protein
MTRYYDELARYERDGFTVIVDKSWEDLAVRDSFDDTCHDIKEIERKIDNGTYDWFFVRVRAMVEDLEMGSAYLGGMLYENPADCLTDGCVEDAIYEALTEAKKDVYRLKQKFAELSDMVDREGVSVV